MKPNKQHVRALARLSDGNHDDFLSYLTALHAEAQSLLETVTEDTHMRRLQGRASVLRELHTNITEAQQLLKKL